MAGEALSFALNRAIALDPDLPGEFAELNGRRLRMTWAGPEWQLQAVIVDGRIRIEKPDQVEADFSLRSTLAGIAGFLRPEAKGSLPVGKVQISGDADLLRRLEQIGRRYQPDLEVKLSERLGPVFGPQLARLVQGVFKGLAANAQDFAETSAEYVLHEGELVPTRDALAEFAADVDRLRDAVERFEAKLQRLQRAAKA